MNTNSTNFAESEEMVARLFTNFGVNESGLEGNAFAWIGEMLAKARVKLPTVPGKVSEANVVAYKTRKPCNYKSGLEVECYPNADTSLKPHIIEKTSQRYIKESNFNEPKQDFWFITSQFIQFSFETGIVNLYYKALPLGSCGLPMIPDNEFFKESVEYHLLFRLLSRGYKHPTYNNPRELVVLRDDAMRKAEIDMKAFGRSEMRTFGQMWNQLLVAYDAQYVQRNLTNLLKDTTFDA